MDDHQIKKIERCEGKKLDGSTNFKWGPKINN